MSRTLILEDGHTRRQLLLTGTLTVGRDPACDINHGDPRLSRRHAELRLTPEGIVVADLHSRNGVWVNGKPVGEALIQPGDVIQIAHLTFRFDDDQRPPAPEPERPVEADATAAPSSGPDDERTRMIPPPQGTGSEVRIKPEAEDDRTRLSHGPPSGARRRSGISQATVPDLGDMLLRADVARQPAVEPIQEVGVGTILRSSWAWRAMATGAALALFVALGTAVPIIALESSEMRAATLRAWPMWAPALAGPALIGALGALLIARTALRGHTSRVRR